MPTDFTVVIATLNRSKLLAGALRSLMQQSFDRARFEVVVVDNGSTDDTRQVVEKHASEASNIRYVQEPRLGLSNGRNRGVAEARGEIVAFFDDDALAEPNWVETLFAIFRDDPEVGAAGGRIHVRWPGERPAWMPLRLEPYYGRCDYGAAKRVVVYPEYPYGSNMAFRREVLQALGGFSDEVGRKGKSLIAAGETELFYRLSLKSIRMVYDPAAVVHHLAAPSHVTRSWILRRTFGHGLASSAMQYVNERPTGTQWLQRIGRATFRSAVGLTSTAVGIITMRDAPTVMSRGSNATYWGGVARGALQHAMRPRLAAPSRREP